MPDDVRQKLPDLNLMEIKALLESAPESYAKSSILPALDEDRRRGAHDLADKCRRAFAASAKKLEREEKMRAHERDAAARGFSSVAGCDEAGRGALAGPLVAAAVILDDSQPIRGLNDSKALSPAVRERLFNEISEKARCLSVVKISPAEIDKLGIQTANITALITAVMKLSEPADFVLSDAFDLGLDIPVRPLIKGDSSSASIAAASIIAKVSRDRIMAKLSSVFSAYRFAQNKGYGTMEHMERIEELGPCPAHRFSFYPIKEAEGAQMRFTET